MAKGDNFRKRQAAQRKKTRNESYQLSLHEQLSQFELFNETVLPGLKKMVLEDWAPEKIRKHFAPLIQAKMIQEGLKGNIKAMQDTLDRHEGTAVQRAETTTRYSKMDRAEMAALALQKLVDAGIIDVNGKRLIKDVTPKDDEKE